MSPERTPEEREAARREREARRAARRQREQGGEPPAAKAGLGGLLGRVGLGGGPDSDGEVSAPEEVQLPPTEVPPPPPGEAPSFDRPAPPPRPRREPAATPRPAGRPRPAAPPLAEPEPPPLVESELPPLVEPEPPPVAEPEPEPEFEPPPPPPPPPPRPPRRPPLKAPPAPSGRRRSRAAVALFAVLALLILVGAWFLLSLFQPFAGDGGERVRVNIPRDAGVGEIADVLAERGVVSSAFFFEARATLSGRRGDLKPGAYTLRRDMSYAAALDALASGPPRNVVQVAVPEGASRRDIAKLARGLGVEGSYLRASARNRELNPRRYGAERSGNLEGFLYPASYELKRGASARTLVSKQLETFKREFRTVSTRRARRQDLTSYDVLIIASMIEREAQVAKERRLISSVIYNRLERDEPLGIDATIRYATNNFSRPLTESDLNIRSPYNTRTRPGLPPTPIGNPGLASIRAAANPADTDYLFYVVKPGSRGEHAFSETLEEFERDARRYNRARERAGGRSPTR